MHCSTGCRINLLFSAAVALWLCILVAYGPSAPVFIALITIVLSYAGTIRKTGAASADRDPGGASPDGDKSARSLDRT